MKIYADHPEFTEEFISGMQEWKNYTFSDLHENLVPAASEIFQGRHLFGCEISGFPDWNYMFAVNHSVQSHYDILTRLSSENITLPGNILCLAGSGEKFHGFRNRHWSSPRGNIYLVAYLSPDQRIKKFGPGYMAVAAVSVVETIDRVAGLEGRSGIKWVNDVIIDGCKVAGVLAYTQAETDNVTGAVIGIGLNVEVAPEIESSIFVPKTGAIADFLESKNDIKKKVFASLLERLGQNCKILENDGYDDLLESYRRRSVCLNQTVEIHPDSPVGAGDKTIAGRLIQIGENLELYIEGQDRPISRGRMVLKS